MGKEPGKIKTCMLYNVDAVLADDIKNDLYTSTSRVYPSITVNKCTHSPLFNANEEVRDACDAILT